MNLKQFGVLLSVSAILGMNVIANKALAADPDSITFGRATASGECSIDGQQVGTDGRTLSLIFNNFNAFNGARKRCIVRVNTTIPAGFSVQDVQVLYQGSTEVGPRSRGTSFSRSYSFSGGAFGQVAATPQIDRYTLTDLALQEQDTLRVLSFSSCGGQGQLGLNLVQQSSAGSNIFIDTADINAGDVLIRFRLRPCR